VRKKLLSDLLSSAPLIIPIGLILFMRPILAPCTKENNCQGTLLVGVAFFGAILAYSFYKINQRQIDKVFSLSQEKRLLWLAWGWIGLFVVVAFEMLYRNKF